MLAGRGRRRPAWPGSGGGGLVGDGAVAGSAQVGVGDEPGAQAVCIVRACVHACAVTAFWTRVLMDSWCNARRTPISYSVMSTLFNRAAAQRVGSLPPFY